VRRPLSSVERMGALSILSRTIRAHPDAVALALIVLVASLFRGQFVFRAPMFMQHDSIGYFLPAYELSTGQGFGVGFRRTPVYPLFLAGVLSASGQSLTSILVAQHILGLVTAGVTYWLGRITFGRGVGLVGGLLVAVNGALIVGEHYLMSEALFIPLLGLALLALVSAARRPTILGCLVAGFLLALAALCRPIAQALFLLVPIAIILHRHTLREVLRGTALVAMGVAAVLLPWTVRNCLTGGECSTIGVVGQAMLARTAYYDRGFVFYDQDDPQRGPDAPRPAIRRSIQRASDQGFSGGAIARRLQVEFKWSDAETARLTREMALDAIRRQSAYYLTGTLAMLWQIYGGEFERLRADWKTQSRRLNRDEWDARVEHFLADPTPEQESEFPYAEALISFWQPVYWKPWLPLLSLVGMAAALLAPGPTRGAAVLGLASLILMFTAAALNGPVARYRYPLDPYIGLLAAGGAAALIRLAWRRVSGWVGPAKRPARRVREPQLLAGASKLRTLDHESV
jgi:4-amino-4-deoxy-L-arabinose transferase-like glycosyltransferase